MTFLMREINHVRRDGDGLVAYVSALRCMSLPTMPGYLTGESPAEQGIETGLPNLPDLPVPEIEQRSYELRLRWSAPDVVRMTLASEGAPVLTDDGTGLGIVIEPTLAECTPTINETDDAVTVSTDRMCVRVHRKPFALEITDLGTGRTLLRTAHRLRQVAGFPMAPAVLVDRRGMTLHLELGDDEDVLGFGEQFGRLVKNGQHLVLRVADALGTGAGMAYKPVPVWHSTQGYTGFLNTGAVVTADVGHRLPSVLGLTVEDDVLDLYVVAGTSHSARLGRYTALTGRSTVPPLWAFGYWLGRCRYHSRAEMEQVAAEMRTRQVPGDVLHLDPDWLIVDRLNTDFCWNTERFGDRREFIDSLDRYGFRLSLWELPYLDPESPRHSEAAEKGFLLRDRDGTLATVDRTPAPDGRPRALLDFTNPDARAWWQSLHQEFLDDGVAVFKTDFGEGVPDSAVPADDTPAHHLHNLYPLRYNAAVSDAIAAGTGRSPLVWGRSGWAGSQRYPAQWGGDAESTVAGMRATLRAGLSYALSAPGFWSHDIGGFFGRELTPELFVRWTQFGALSPLMRAHGLRPREPWALGEEAFRVVLRWIRFRYELLPYLWQTAHASAANGWPMLRPLAFEFPYDPIAAGIDDSYLLGADLLVAPVFDDGPGPVTRQCYVPEGHWVDWFTGRQFDGPAFHRVEVGLESIPLLIRSGAIIPTVVVGPEVRRTDDLIGSAWTIHTTDVTNVQSRLIGFDGSTTHVHLNGTQVTAEGTQPVQPTVRRHPVGITKEAAR